MAFTIVSLLGNNGKGRQPQALATQACITVLSLNDLFRLHIDMTVTETLQIVRSK